MVYCFSAHLFQYMLTPTNNWHSTGWWLRKLFSSTSKIVPKMQFKYVLAICMHIECVYFQCGKIRRLSVRMAKWHRLFTFEMECCRSLLCMHNWTISNVLAHTHTIFSELFRCEFLFISTSVFVRCLNSRFHYSTKVQLLLGNLCVHCACVCITSVSIDAYVCTLFPTFPWCSARVHVMHLYVL